MEGIVILPSLRYLIIPPARVVIPPMANTHIERELERAVEGLV